MMWGALILVLGVTTTAETIDMFFSGGGIRATFGTLIAMCEVRKYWEGVGNKTFKVDNIVGLSGGAWGVSILGATDLNPCLLVERVQNLTQWGRADSFRSIRCQKEPGSSHATCFRGWKNDIETWFGEVLKTDRKVADAETGVDLNMKVPKGFGHPQYAGDYSRVWIQTDPCHFTGGSHMAHGDGACIVGANELHFYCIRDADTVEREKLQQEFTTSVAECVVADGQKAELTYNDLLAFSSAAWASASAVSYAVQFAVWIGLAGDKRSPEVTCGDDMVSSLCDAGGECNLPLGAIDVLYLSDFFTIADRSVPQFISWDFSDNDGDLVKSVDQCVTKWSRTQNWELLGNKPMSWGYSLLLRGTEHSHHHEFVLHVVVFRGVTKAHKLVKEFPTLSGTDPNFFTPEKASLVAREYGGFLTADLFGAAQHPFNTPAATFRTAILAHAPTPHPRFAQHLGALIPGY